MRKELYQIVECRDCAFAWLYDPPPAEEMANHSSSDYHRLITSSGEVKLLRRWREPRERVLSACEAGSLLDVGCSSGGFLRTMKSES